MIFRNSIKSIFRTPVKTLFFALLIAAVSAFFYLGVNTWMASAAMLADCDENHTTIVTIEYLDSGSNNTIGYKSDAMARDVAAIDFETIAANENVLLWQPADESLCLAAGFSTKSNDAEAGYNCVIIVTGVRQYSEGSYYSCKLVECLYSAREYRPGSTLFIESSARDFGFEPDANATYVILGKNIRANSMGGMSIRLNTFYSWTAQLAGVDCTAIASAYPIESAEALHADPDNVYLAIANYYNTAGNALTLCRTREPADLEEFSQEYLLPVSGRLFTREESETGATVCVISQTLANNRNLAVGDTLTLHLPDEENAAVYPWGDRLSRQESYTVVGIVNYHTDYHLNVYVPSAADNARPVRYMGRLGQATIQNGTADAFLAQLKPLLPENVFVTVYDHGYQAAANALMVIQKAAMALSAIALGVTLAVLAFFAYLFADTQREAVEIMRCFGMKKGEARRYLMVGVSLIALAAIGTGIFIGALYAIRLIEYAYSFISVLQVIDLRYSDGFRGIIKEFTLEAMLSYPLAAAIGTGIFLGALGLCLYYAERVVSGRLIAVRAKARTPKPSKSSSVVLRGWLRHAALSIRRSGVRSALAPLLCAAALLFISTLQTTLTSYDRAREELYDNTRLSGYLAQMNGRFSGNLFLPNEVAAKLTSLESLSNPACTYRFNYAYLGVSRHADGREGQPDPVPQPADPFVLELLRDILDAAPNLIFTDRAAGSPEFYFAGFHCNFLPGWDEAAFSSRRWTQLPCIVSDQFLRLHDITLGDTIRIYIGNKLSSYPYFLGVDMQVVGSFTPVSNENNIYCPMPLGALDPENSTLSQLPFKGSPSLQTNGYRAYAANYYPINYVGETMTQQQFADVLLDTAYYISSLTFTIENPRMLPAVKDELALTGFSGPNMDNRIRTCVVIQDAQFTETLSALAQRTKFAEILYPVLVTLVCVLGGITGFLSVNSRREDIALMRGMGVRKRHIFATVYGEQMLLLLLGLLPAALGWLCFNGMAQLATWSVYSFFLCYAASAALSVLLQNGKTALSILSEKE